MLMQKADLVPAGQELTAREDHGVLQADWAPGYVDLISTARGARPIPVGGGAVTPPTTTGATGEESTFAQRGFYAQTSAFLLLPYRQGRSYLFIQNNDAANTMYVAFGTSVGTNNGVKIPAGGYYEPYMCPDNEIYVLGSAANVAGVIIEGFKVPAGAKLLPYQVMLNQRIATDVVSHGESSMSTTYKARLPGQSFAYFNIPQDQVQNWVRNGYQVVPQTRTAGRGGGAATYKARLPGQSFAYFNIPQNQVHNWVQNGYQVSPQ